jgi:hypothetical protein
MRTGRIRCQVVEVPKFTPSSRMADGCCRDLLPWADPYIAALMAQLEGQLSDAELSESHPRSQNTLDGSDSYSAADGDWSDDDDSVLADELDDTGSHLDYPPVVGGWPLLNDDAIEEEPC